MTKSLSSSAQRVQASLDSFGLRLQVVELPDSTRTAQDAAHAIGCKVGQIAKSLIFKAKETYRPLLVVTSGSNLVDVGSIERLAGEKISLADADFVREHTGFAIGGVPPVGHKSIIVTFIDEDLLKYDEIWAAAGTPHAVFRLSGDALVEATGGKVISVTEQTR